jgi:hypothetical protein
MTDKELLELASKAAGYDVRWHDIWKCFVHVNPHYIDYPHTMAGSRHEWVPLDDDGDALRLAVDIRILDDNKVRVAPFVWEGQDARAITRRAIVEVAAEIGRTK